METFGSVSGAAVKRIRIGNEHLSATILNYGAVVQDLRLASVSHPLVLGFDDFDSYLQHSLSFGILAGRHANRIKDGLLPLEGKQWQLDCNEADKTHLHGGSEGTGSRIWDVVAVSDASVHLRILCKDGEMGYPGNLTIDCIISIAEPSTLVYDISAVTDATTVCNLAPHSYFNLDGAQSIKDHQLQIVAEHYLPIDQLGIPTGEIASVSDTEFDFRTPRSPVNNSGNITDHNYCLHNQPRALSHAATLTSSNRLALEVFTTEPGLQFYDGNKVQVSVPGLDGQLYGAYAGLCLEPQRWPNSMYHDNFAGAVLHPQEQYLQRSEFRLTRD